MESSVMSQCYFSSNRPVDALRTSATDLSSIKCDIEGLQPISDRLSDLPDDIPLFGCTPVELLFMRGNGEDVSLMDDPEKHLICNEHLKFLLLKWPSYCVQQKYSPKRGDKNPTCALPHEDIRIVPNRVYLKKEEALKHLSLTGELVHVGSAICSTHRANLRNGIDGGKLSKSKRIPPRRGSARTGDDTEFVPGDIDYPSADVYDRSEDDSDDDQLVSAEPLEPSVEDQISHHFSEIARLLGNNHYATKLKWSTLAPDTQRRKVSMILTMLQVLCSLVAPDHVSDLLEQVAKKITPKCNTAKDACASQVLSAIGDRILDAPNRRTRLETLALIVDLPYFRSYKILTSILTVTKYLIHKARLFNCGGINFNEVFTKVRYNEEAIDFLVSFLVRSNVLMSLSWINNYAKRTDGSLSEMGVSVRLHAYNSIDRMFRSELQKYNKTKEFHLSTGTIYQLLKGIVPKRNIRMQCVDEYAVDAGEGWDRLKVYVSDLGAMGYLSSSEQADLLRRVKISKSFLEGSYRSHIELSSNIMEHCATYALSDQNKKVYKEDCTHSHDEHCVECIEIDRVLQLLLDKISWARDDAEKEGKSERHKLDRMDGMAKKMVNYIVAYKAHLVRAVVSDTEKSLVQENLHDNSALVTADWAQKLLPQSAVEPQSGYFAKSGMSVHITHVFAKFNGKTYHHSIQHVFESCKQKSRDVSAILRHSFDLLKRKNINEVFLRSDNAGGYKSADLIGDLYQIANASPRIERYFYSESQAGKGPCDRSASHIKRKVNDATGARKNARDAKEVFDALTKNEPGTSTYLCIMNDEEEKPMKSAIPDISSIFDISFEDEGINARRHCGIGEGLNTPSLKLHPLNASLTVIEEGGFIDDPDFWVCLDKDDDDDEVEEGEEECTLSVNNRKDFECSTSGCLKSFLTLRNLEKHEIIGNHKFRPKKQSLLDFTIDTFNRKIETVEVARGERECDSFKDTTLTNNAGLASGWALKSNAKKGISNDAYDAAAKYFDEQRKMKPPRKAEPRVFSLMMEEMVESDGTYTFMASELLTEKQLLGLFGRLEKKRLSGVSIARPTRGRKTSKSSRKRRNPSHSDDEADEVVLEESDHEDDVSEEETDEQAFVWECIDKNHKNIFKSNHDN